ncbi:MULTISPECIES: tyrosine-type recombinase/integrase [unclassified Novosphingobium]|uniref:tyrosine-type recombinase/integrase n=1 Tax=unclassified Novosphingobium TaxID=2644732 RepID=UPI001359FAB1|nr:MULTISPECIES: tyrosine-type recombinase/integrase [unclassified Novosphingobium]
MPLAALRPAPAPVPIIAQASAHARTRFLEFFAAAIRNPNTRRAYAKSCTDFLTWCFEHGVHDLAAITPIHVAGWIEELGASLSAPTVKQRLAAVRHLFDWLVTGQVMPFNPASSVRGPAHSARTGRTPVLEPEEARALIDGIDLTSPTGLRDRALIGLMVYTFARVGAALSMRHEDVFVQGRRLWVRLHEKGGKRHEMPCHHLLDEYLTAYIEALGPVPAKTPLFRALSRTTKRLEEAPLTQGDAFAMVRRRAQTAGIATKIGNHTFRATGITTYLKNGGSLENAAAMAGHASTRTTQIYDRRRDEITLAEVERVRL